MKITVEMDINTEGTTGEFTETWRRSVAAGIVDDIVKVLQEKRRHLGERGVSFRLFTDDLPEGAVPGYQEVLEVCERFTDEKVKEEPLIQLTSDGRYQVSTARWILKWLLDLGLLELRFRNEHNITSQGRRELQYLRGDYDSLFNRIAEKIEDETSADGELPDVF